MKTAAWKSAFCSLAAALLLAGCGAPAETEIIKEESPAMPTAAVETAAPVTPSPEPTPTPVPLLGIPAGDYQKRFDCEENGQWLDYYVFVPENACEGLPLIIYLHGDGMTSRLDWLPDHDIAKMAKEAYGYDFPFILLTPNNRYPEWYNGGMNVTLKNLIDTVAADYKCDLSKIIITGHSRGAIATWQMADEFGTFFSCAVPVSCGANKIHGENFIGVPVNAFVGTGEMDQSCYRRDMKYFVELINSAGGQASLTEIEGHDHDTMCTAPYTKELFEWMISQ